jgi:DNA-binding transcriptional ArsR family regulator/uncharacterized protein YndB with AHSA1/START domain
VDVLAVLAEPSRRRIVDELRRSECSVGDLVATLGLSQPAVSKHLRVLREAGIVTSRTAAQQRIYRLEPGPFSELDAWLGPYRRALDRPPRRARPPPRPPAPPRGATMTLDSGPLADARVVPDDGVWTLIFIRDLPHPPEAVWQVLTEPAELDQWAPFTVDRHLGAAGDATLTMIDGDTRMPLAVTVRRAQAPALLEYTWGGDLLRWELAAVAAGTRLTLRHTLAQPDMDPMVAAGWHLCLAVLDRLLAGEPVGVVRGRDAMDHGWERLRDAYAAKLGG